MIADPIHRIPDSEVVQAYATDIEDATVEVQMVALHTAIGN